ncbi:uncharacterized protein JCM6883_005740 [Sporobolomyces salmoneus]|uniref:uncharacterized protein n=1 Tax=Sporobolomyces salmoneus TaxID=183962 RepID=UPI0031755755
MISQASTSRPNQSSPSVQPSSKEAFDSLAADFDFEEIEELAEEAKEDAKIQKDETEEFDELMEDEGDSSSTSKQLLELSSTGSSNLPPSASSSRQVLTTSDDLSAQDTPMLPPDIAAPAPKPGTRGYEEILVKRIFKPRDAGEDEMSYCDVLVALLDPDYKPGSSSSYPGEELTDGGQCPFGCDAVSKITSKKPSERGVKIQRHVHEHAKTRKEEEVTRELERDVTLGVCPIAGTVCGVTQGRRCSDLKEILAHVHHHADNRARNPHGGECIFDNCFDDVGNDKEEILVHWESAHGIYGAHKGNVSHLLVFCLECFDWIFGRAALVDHVVTHKEEILQRAEDSPDGLNYKSAPNGRIWQPSFCFICVGDDRIEDVVKFAPSPAELRDHARHYRKHIEQLHKVETDKFKPLQQTTPSDLDSPIASTSAAVLPPPTATAEPNSQLETPLPPTPYTCIHPFCAKNQQPPLPSLLDYANHIIEVHKIPLCGGRGAKLVLWDGDVESLKAQTKKRKSEEAKLDAEEQEAEEGDGSADLSGLGALQASGSGSGSGNGGGVVGGGRTGIENVDEEVDELEDDSIPSGSRDGGGGGGGGGGASGWKTKQTNPFTKKSKADSVPPPQPEKKRVRGKQAKSGQMTATLEQVANGDYSDSACHYTQPAMLEWASSQVS